MSRLADLQSILSWASAPSGRLFAWVSWIALLATLIVELVIGSQVESVPDTGLAANLVESLCSGGAITGLVIVPISRVITPWLTVVIGIGLLVSDYSDAPWAWVVACAVVAFFGVRLAMGRVAQRRIVRHWPVAGPPPIDRRRGIPMPFLSVDIALGTLFAATALAGAGTMTAALVTLPPGSDADHPTDLLVLATFTTWISVACGVWFFKRLRNRRNLEALWHGELPTVTIRAVVDSDWRLFLPTGEMTTTLIPSKARTPSIARHRTPDREHSHGPSLSQCDCLLVVSDELEADVMMPSLGWCDVTVRGLADYGRPALLFVGNRVVAVDRFTGRVRPEGEEFSPQSVHLEAGEDAAKMEGAVAGPSSTPPFLRPLVRFTERRVEWLSAVAIAVTAIASLLFGAWMMSSDAEYAWFPYVMGVVLVVQIWIFKNWCTPPVVVSDVGLRVSSDALGRVRTVIVPRERIESVEVVGGHLVISLRSSPFEPSSGAGKRLNRRLGDSLKVHPLSLMEWNWLGEFPTREFDPRRPIAPPHIESEDSSWPIYGTPTQQAWERACEAKAYLTRHQIG